MKNRLAVFDIDGTVYRWSLFIEMVYELIQADIFPKSAYKKMLASYLLWLERKIHYSEYAKEVIEIYHTNLKGCAAVEVKKVARDVLRRKRDRVYRFTRDLIEKLKRKSYFLLAISGSPSYIVADFARSFGFQEGIGVEYEVKKGKFTGVMADPAPALDKKKVISRFLKRYANTFDLKNSIAVGDTETDISLLEVVGKPIAFNPNKNLVEEARARGWRIVVERKDVIFEIKDFKQIKISS